MVVWTGELHKAQASNYGADECGRYWTDEDGRLHACIRHFSHVENNCSHLCHCGKTRELRETEK